MKHEPMTQERLDAIRARLDARGVKNGARDMRAEQAFAREAPQDLADLLAEVKRLRHFESIVSWWYGDTTDGKTRADMVERAERAFGTALAQVSSVPPGMSVNMYIDGVSRQYDHAIRAALDAALGTGEEA